MRAKNVLGAFTLAVILGMHSMYVTAEDDCPVTVGSALLGPPFPNGQYWYGSEGLAVSISGDTWLTTRSGADLAVKLFWWSAGFEPGMENNLTVLVKNFDGTESSAQVSKPTNAKLGEEYTTATWTILTGFHLPDPGCLIISGEYQGQTLTFIVRVSKNEFGADDAT